MMGSGFQKRIMSMLIAASMVLSALFADSMLGLAAENQQSIETRSFDGADVGSGDGSDVGSNDGSDVSGSDVSGNHQDMPFVVTDGSGEQLGSYEDWYEVLADFTAKGDAGKDYIISVTSEGVVGKTLPAKAKSITLKTADEDGIIYLTSNTINLTVPLTVDARALYVADSDKVVNINTKGKTLTLKNTEKIGTLKGTSKGSLVVVGDVALQGNLQTFKEVKVSGFLSVNGNVASVTKLTLQKGTVYLTAGKKFTVTNVDAAAEGVLGFPANGKLPTVKVNGTINGVLQLKQFAEQDGVYTEQEFAAGTKLLTASKATVEQFALKGEKQVCYKKGNVIYVGAEVLVLYKGEEHVGTYAQWSDLRTKINTLKDKTADYRVVLLDDYVVNGALSMPTKGRYVKLTLVNGKGSPVRLEASGGLTMTADMVLDAGITLAVKQISGAARRLELGENARVIATGNVTVKELILKQNAGMQSGGKLSVKGTLEASTGNELLLAHKKAAAIKDTVTTDRIILKLVDKQGNRVTPIQNTTVISVSGTSYATQYCLLDEKEQEMLLYRKGNTLRVRGSISTPIALYFEEEGNKVSLGEYATLGDVKTEIGRRKVKQGVYHVEIGEELSVKGAIPLPKAGTYQSIFFTGKPIYTTGNLTLTGDAVFHNEIYKTKKEEQVPLAVNLGKYTLTIPADGSFKSLGNVTGATGSCLLIAEGAQQHVEGNLKVGTLRLDGILRVDGTVNVTDIYPGAGNRLDYELAKSTAIKGTVYGQQNKLLLNPLRTGKTVTFTENMKLLTNAPKVVVSQLELVQKTDWVLYRDGNAVRLGKSLLSVFENTLDYEGVWNAELVGSVRFARFNDAVDYINESTGTDYVIRLEENIPSAGSFKAPVSDKKVVVCGLAGERKTLNLTGSINMNGGSLHLHNIELDNKTVAGPSVTLKNGAGLQLCDTGINALSAPEGTAVILEGQVTIGGIVNGSCDLTLKENAVVRAAGAMTVGSLTLDAAEAGKAQLRMRVGKKFAVSKEINTPKDGQFILNRVDQKDELAGITKGTVMVTAPYGQSSQFKTQNIMPGTFMEWSLVKKGNDIQTSEASQGDGEWSGDFL